MKNCLTCKHEPEWDDLEYGQRQGMCKCDPPVPFISPIMRFFPGENKIVRIPDFIDVTGICSAHEPKDD